MLSYERKRAINPTFAIDYNTSTQHFLTISIPKGKDELLVHIF